MSEEESASVSEVSNSTEPSTESTQSTENQTSSNARPAGYDPIDETTATPQQVKERLDYLYRQVKDNDRYKKEANRVLADQSRVINELSQAQQQVVTHLQDRTITDNEVQLQQMMQTAWEKGDTAMYNQTQSRLIDLKVQKNLLTQTRQQPPQVPPSSGMPNISSDEGAISQAEQQATYAWQNERDEQGSLLRPWAFNNSSDQNNLDPNYLSALREAQAVFTNPKFANLPYDQKLAEVDKRMGLSKRTASQTVMGGNLTTARKTGKLTLTPKQEEIAIRTKYAGPKAKSDADHLDAYRKQVERVQSGRKK